MSLPNTTSVPKSCFILVIGGGPSGSYAASCLAREGLPVVVLEAEKFPRYHVGESMLPSMRHFLRFIELEEKFENFGFIPKLGAAFKFNPHKREGFSDFISEDKGNYSWNVTRADADALIFNHAKESGARCFDGVRVTRIDFEERGGVPCPKSAAWKTSDGQSGEISFEWLIDASGRNGLISKHLKTRKFNQSLKNIACWGYWRGASRYENGLAAIGPPFFEALKDESGWAWFIPLHNGTTSVGIVMDEEISKKKKAILDKEHSTLTDHYIKEMDTAPGIKKLLENATLVKETTPAIKSASDYSYSATSYSGPNYRIVGDAGAFIDPFFSSGVHLALSGGLSAAATICATIRGDCTSVEASNWHNVRVGTSYTRFLIVVLSAYRQIRAQELPVLADVDEDNFDRAFEHFRLVIQGDADHKKLSEEELRSTIDFCTQAFEPDTLEDWHRNPMGPNGEDVGTETKSECPCSSAPAEEPPKDIRKAPDVLAARKTLGAVDMFSIGKFVADKLEGFSIRLEKGKLGLEA
ncbi:hypothetical protein BDQ17DRAFT_1391411 [Cyathus striatus]|nr:hypothetical protein BDQ17DRAFT_1391411 [Cyathus striatus]